MSKIHSYIINTKGNFCKYCMDNNLYFDIHIEKVERIQIQTNKERRKMGYNEQLRYDVDIVMCIDATASMGPFLDLVKSQALNLYGDIKRKMEVELETPKYIDELRVQVIAFRDYLADGDNAMLTSGFYSLPAQAEEFEALVRGIQPMGGGDLPEDGLEALAYAIKSKWSTHAGNKHRQIIVVWTDDGTHDLGHGKKAVNYPAKMPASFAELTEWWGFIQCPGLMDNDAKRLLIYAPAKEWWTTITETWNNTLLFASQAGKGLDHLTYDEILSAIAQSI